MKIGQFTLRTDGLLAGTLDHHGARKELTLKALPSNSGPSHEMLISGRATQPPSHAWPTAGGVLKARLSLNNGATTLYLSLQPTGDGGYAIHWDRPRATDQSRDRIPERAR